MIEKQDIYDASNGGLDVILDYITVPRAAQENYAVKFKCDTLKVENNASLGLTKNDSTGIWVVKDWAGDDIWNAFDVTMEFESCDFASAVKILADKYNLTESKGPARSYGYEKIEAPEGAVVKHREWEYLDDFDLTASKNLFGKNAWKYLSEKAITEDHKKGMTDDEVALYHAKKIFTKYGFAQLAWHSIVSKDKKSDKLYIHKFTATKNYPIFVWKVWKPFANRQDNDPVGYKFYEPYNTEMRFSFYGELPTNYFYGIEQIAEAYDNLENDAGILERLGIDPDNFDGHLGKILEEVWENHREPNKLPDIQMVSGGTDALNVAAFGYLPYWSNSETIDPKYVPFKRLKQYAWRNIYVGDIDDPGIKASKKFAEQHIDMYVAYLPDELKSFYSRKLDKDGKRKPKKDIKDFFDHFTHWDYKRVLAQAKCLRFWSSTPKMDGKYVMKKEGQVVYKYSPKPSYILNYLRHSGFTVLERKKLNGISREFVLLIENRVRRLQDTSEMKAAVDNFVATHSFDHNLADSMLRSRDLSDSVFSRILTSTLDFKDYDKHYQYIFLSNVTWKITKDGIEESKPNSSDKFVWEHEVISKTFLHPKTNQPTEVKFKKTARPFSIAKQTDSFDIFFDSTSTDGSTIVLKDKEGEPISIKKDHEVTRRSSASEDHVNCMYLKYLINTSRIHWQKELEERLDKWDFKTNSYPPDTSIAYTSYLKDLRLDVKSKEEYRDKYRFAIAGPLLTPSEQHEQKMHLINKISSIGKMVHRYKSMSNAKLVWSMDYVMKDTDKSQGGTGKSLTPLCLTQVLPNEKISGRDKRALANAHVFENISEDTDMLWLDDAHKETDMSFFFSAVTGFMKKNPKGTKSETIDFADSPQIWITSNYPPLDFDEDSTARRIFMTEYSDFYHYNKSKMYRNQHQPADDLGKDLITDFDQDDWNNFLNTVATCCQYYIRYGMIDSGDDNMLVNAYRSYLGTAFLDWANLYFAPENLKTDNFLHKKKLYQECRIGTGLDYGTTNFGKKLKAYIAMRNWELNPDAIVKHKQSDGRVTIKKDYDWLYEAKSNTWELKALKTPVQTEFYYIQTSPDEEINWSQINANYIDLNDEKES